MKLICCFLVLFSPSLALAESDTFISYLCHGKTGIKIWNDGNVNILHRLEGGKEVVQLPVGTYLDSTAKIFALVESGDFLKSNYEKGKCLITYHTPEIEHIVTYNAKAPKAVQDVFGELQTLYLRSTR